MRYDVADGVATLTMDHVENRNAMTAELLNGLGTHLERALGDDHVRVIVLTNEGPAFSAGADLKAGRGASPGGDYTLPRILTLMLDGPKPVVGRIAGHCMGGGVGLAAACDLSIAAEDVRFGFTEVRIGVAPAVISVVVLPKLRRGDALELFLTGERITASRAVEVGLITRCAPPPSLDEAVSATVGQLVAGGPLALGAAKQLVRVVPGLNRDDAFSWTAQRSAELFASEEAAEGMAAFRDRRPASWLR
ncbi:MAG: enoyl-CoA hydratase/isomerase family protein [Acidimicrobiaceae bacterium]|nr:enoyl-CoA hydratase/isomerase family protein [Acidimicrobiaceae bacterium]